MSDLMSDFKIQDVLFVTRQDADCADDNKDVRIEATLFISRLQAQPNQAVKSHRETALI